VRFNLLFDNFRVERDRDFGLDSRFHDYLKFYRRREGGLTLLELAEAVDQVGLRGDRLGRMHLFPYGGAKGCYGALTYDWDLSQLTGFFQARPHVLEEALGLIPGRPKPEMVPRALQVMALLEDLSPSLLEFAFQQGLGKKHRAAGRAAVAGRLDLAERLPTVLSSRKADERAAAADWLAELGLAAAVPALRAAATREKQPAVADALARALEKLSAVELAPPPPTSSSPIPSSLDWFPWSRTEHGDLVLRAFQGGSVEPAPWLREAMRQLPTAEREELGQLVLTSWIAWDTEPLHSEAEIQARCERLPADSKGLIAARLCRKTVRSAIKHKALLAVAAAGCGPAAVPVIHAYLERFYGNRQQHCLALLEVLAWLEAAEATALLLDLARGFKTASLQQAAGEAARRSGARRGWSEDELEDRSVAALALSPDLKAVDPAEAKAAKALVARETRRLADALALQRPWSAEAWRARLAHPALGPLSRRLLWTLDDGPTFCCLDDGSLCDAEHDSVCFSEGTVRLAHAALLPDPQRWRTFLAELNLPLLLAQLDGAPPPPAPAGPEFPLPEPEPEAKALSRRARGESYQPHYLDSHLDSYRRTIGPYVAMLWLDEGVLQVLDVQERPLELASLPPVLWWEIFNQVARIWPGRF